jgi:hypothetical protein
MGGFLNLSYIWYVPEVEEINSWVKSFRDVGDEKEICPL